MLDQYMQEDNVKWKNSVEIPDEDDDGDWVDENEDDEEDLLQLEYHPSFIQKTEKRRRRWEGA